MRVKRGIAWQVLNSWWVLLPLLLGFPAWAAFLYTSRRGRKRLWLIWSAVYFVAFLPAYLVPESSWPGTSEGEFLVAYMTISFVHALVIRYPFLRRLELLQEYDLLSESEVDEELARRVLQLKEERVERMLRDGELRDATRWEDELRRSDGEEARRDPGGDGGEVRPSPAGGGQEVLG